MSLVRPRLNDYYDLAFTQEDAPFAIPLLDEDIPLYIDPFLLWRSPSQQDQALHTALIASFNHIALLGKRNEKQRAVEILVTISECSEVGLGTASNKGGKRIGAHKALEILSLFEETPQIQRDGLKHLEILQLLVDQVSRDRISDFTANLLKSFLIDFTVEQSRRFGIPTAKTDISNLFDLRSQALTRETVNVPVNPHNGAPVLLVPKRWLRFIPWINFDDFFAFATASGVELPREKVALLNYNRENYGLVERFLEVKQERLNDCKNDPLFSQIPIVSAKRKLAELIKLPSGNKNNADKKYEANISSLLSSMLYPSLDFASSQSRTDSGVLIRDLVFYNSRSVDFLQDIYRDYGSRQLVFELKNVASIEREHINQLNRYLNEHFGRFGVLVTRNPLSRAMQKNTIDLWSGQRKCIVVLTDRDLELMVEIYNSKQRLPIEVLKRNFVEFIRSCPS